MDGVPLFFWCAAGVSSRTLDAPYCLTRIASMYVGPRKRPTSSETSPAMIIRNEGYRRTLKAGMRSAKG